MTSPMNAPGLHDSFVLLDGAKRRPLPGVARVTVGLAANIDTQQPAGDSTAVTQLSESTAEVTVQLTMWTHAQWMAYQSLLQVFRRGTKTGPAVFTTAHPEVTARRVKRLYFVSEQGEPYNPAVGYKVSIKFSEKLKEKSATQSVGTSEGSIDNAVGVDPSTGNTPANSEAGARVVAAARANGAGTPAAKTRNGVNDISEGGYCSAWQRVVGTQAGFPATLYGETALQTEAQFRAAKLSEPWSSASQGQLQVGSQIFYGNDPSDSGHVGTYVGMRADGTPMVLSNNLVTYQARGGIIDRATGRATGYDSAGKKVDARGEVPLLGLGTPTSVAPPPGQPVRVRQGPVAPAPTRSGATTPRPTPVALPPNRPSQSVPLPPTAALFTPTPSPLFNPRR
ncbi:hypothetical protein E7T06_07315 [Deinococcus sp. Arct2-2]|uniref:hypothetical protein n=1 Tax=Deinococcus sp. Arct2-2 TaxID=2568653 RepID=UPI0010A41963|nr:hypothetical protein [Deinococcus sp. Arct2-2]THF70506.1 hypothetical protein E7T06_07315 [Deinococcus sp. Arct2-2]